MTVEALSRVSGESKPSMGKGKRVGEGYGLG